MNGDGSPPSVASTTSVTKADQYRGESVESTSTKENTTAENVTEKIASASSFLPSDSKGLKINEEGFLLWGRVKGYSYWPGVITVDPEDGLTEWSPGDNGAQFPKYHVHFLGYENQRAWLTERSIMEYRGYEEYKRLAEGSKGSKRKEFYPASKALMKQFLKAVDLAEKARALPPQDRLPMLGYVYLLIEPKRKKKRQKSLPAKPSIDSGVGSSSTFAQNRNGAKDRLSGKKRKRSDVSPRKVKDKNGKQKMAKTSKIALNVIPRYHWIKFLVPSKPTTLV